MVKCECFSTITWQLQAIGIHNILKIFLCYVLFVILEEVLISNMIILFLCHCFYIIKNPIMLTEVVQFIRSSTNSVKS